MAKFQIYEDAKQEHRWRLVSNNGRIIGDSGEGYRTSQGAEKAIRRFQLVIVELMRLELELPIERVNK